jgi:hypothetical protein
MNVFSSLYLPAVPEYISSAFQWDKINWLMNHLDWFDGYEWYDVQAALWKLANFPVWDGQPANGGIPAWTDMPIAQDMLNMANTYGENYLPLPGGYAAVIFASPDGQQIQTQFILVDP